jgi:hypothetical protein
MERRSLRIRRSTLAEQGKERDLDGTTPAERLAMVWPLTVEAWALAGYDADAPMQKHVVRIGRRRS